MSVFLINPYAFGASPPAPSAGGYPESRYFRIVVTGTSGSFPQIRSLRFVSGDQVALVPATITSSTLGDKTTELTDPTTATGNISTYGNIDFDFTTPVRPEQLEMRAFEQDRDHITSADIFSSDDGITWVQIGSWNENYDFKLETGYDNAYWYFDMGVGNGVAAQPSVYTVIGAKSAGVMIQETPVFIISGSAGAGVFLAVVNAYVITIP